MLRKQLQPDALVEALIIQISLASLKSPFSSLTVQPGVLKIAPVFIYGDDVFAAGRCYGSQGKRVDVIGL